MEPGTGAILYVTVLFLHVPAAPVIAPAAEGTEPESATDALAVPVQPLSSEMVTVYNPGISAVSVAVLSPFDHKYV